MCAQPKDQPAKTMAGVGEADALTGVLNRAGFDARLLQEWERARRAEAPLSLLLIDIDYFRAYVDAHRAPQGDDRLKTIAAALGRAVFRPTDVVARYGDDEFAILLPVVHEAGARVVAARVRSQINALAMPHRGGVGGIVTVSIGVAAFSPAADTVPQQLVALCERALEEAKRLGRDNIVSQDWMT